MQLFNIIILLLLIHTIVHLIRGGKSQVLSCGLFGYLSSPEHSTFNWDKFNHLGLDNDERGGDSIGRAVGENVVKHVNNKKAKTTYQEYVIEHKNSEPSHIALGHTRKASVGVISEATAQPVVLNIPDSPDGGRFIMVHNGTLYNHEALADKYGVTKIGKSDSMILAEILMNHGTQVLKEYEGAAALIWRDDRFPNSLFLFKGESLGFNGKLSEERPLYYYQESENSMYISSKPDGLYFIGGDADNVYDFDTNKLYEIYEGVIVDETIIDRSKCSQIRKWEPVVNNYVKKHFNKSDNNAYEYSQRSFYENEEYWSAYESGESAVINTTALPKIYEEGVVMYNTEFQIVFGQMRYWFWKRDANNINQKHLANGIIALDKFGYKKVNENADPETHRIYFFFDGIMLKNKSAWKTVNKMFKAKPYDDSYNNNKIVSKYSVYPICTIGGKVKIQNTIWSSDPAKDADPQYFTGSVRPIFSYYEYTFNRGDLTKRVSLGSKTPPQTFSKDVDVNKAPMVVVSGLIKNSQNLEPKSSIILPQNYAPASNTELKLVKTNVDVESIYEKEQIPFETGETNATANVVEEEESTVDPIVQKEINETMCTIMIALDDCKSSLETIGDDSVDLKTVVENLSKIEDVLYNRNQFFQKKQLLIAYEEF